jgi:hypothetical protein
MAERAAVVLAALLTPRLTPASFFRVVEQEPEPVDCVTLQLLGHA